MSHSHHGGGGGGGGGATGGLQTTNKHLAESYWYIIAGATGLAAAIRGINYLEGRRRLKRCHAQSLAHPTKPGGRLTQAWATATAIIREASYPRFFVPKKGLRWASPPSLGRILLLIAYWAVIINMMTAHGAIIKDVFYWERVGFRNGWTTIMQMPLLYLLSMKFNIIGYITGTSHERLNWLHRWVGRTMFVTATVHGFHFWTQWERAEIIEWQMRILPITKQGLGAWALLLWTILTTFKPFRHMAYELFIVQHILTAIFFLWLVYVHIPEPARPYLWFSVACICLDRLARWGLLLWQNLRPKPDRSDCKGMKRIGHQAQVRTVGASTTVLTIKDVSFSWKAGQHLYLWLPRLGPFEAHPYTIACAHQLPETCICNSVQLVIRKHGGFSKRLHNHAEKIQEAGRNETLTAFVIGPFGAPPRWDIYETIILISASTGASFTLPILEAIVQGRAKTCVKRVEFVLTACQGEEIDFYLQRLREAVDRAHAMGLELTVHIAITRSDGDIEGVTSVLNNDGRVGTAESLLHRRGNSSSSDAEVGEMEEKDAIRPVDAETGPRCHMMKGSCCAGESSSSGGSDFLRQYTTRLDIESLIREPVEAAGGETSVVVCGGQSLTSSVRNCVTRLSDERAVHKGTGAQGIHLYVEEYSF